MIGTKAQIRWDGICGCGCHFYAMDFIVRIHPRAEPFQDNNGQLMFLLDNEKIDAFDALTRRIMIVEEVFIDD